MSIFIKKTLWTFFFVLIGAIGVSMGLKAAVGVGAWDAFSQSFSYITSIKVGTFSMMLNISCVLLQLILLKRAFKPLAFLQIGMAILLGIMVNLVYYDIMSTWVITSLLLRYVMLISSLLIVIFALSMIMSIDFLSFPLEAACMVVSTKTNISFSKLRQGVDVVCIVIAVGISLLYQVPFTVREGTIFGMIMFAPLLSYGIVKAKPFVKRFGF